MLIFSKKMVPMMIYYLCRMASRQKSFHHFKFSNIIESNRETTVKYWRQVTIDPLAPSVY